jgi:hypothetical protein
VHRSRADMKVCIKTEYAHRRSKKKNNTILLVVLLIPIICTYLCISKTSSHQENHKKLKYNVSVYWQSDLCSTERHCIGRRSYRSGTGLRDAVKRSKLHVALLTGPGIYADNRITHM